METHHNIFKELCVIIILLVFSSGNVFSQAALKKIGKFNTGMSYGLSIANDYAYITTNTSLIILDVTTPEKPVKVGELAVGSPVFGLSVTDKYAFLAASDRGLIIVDISDPREPHIVGGYNSGGTMYNAKSTDNYCYTINYEIGFEIFDISDPAEPKKVSGFPLTPRGFWIQDDIAFVSDPGDGLFILDISNPQDIKKLDVIDGTKGAGGIRVQNGVLFLGSFDNWINVYDISDPRSLQFVTRYTYPYEVSGFAVTGDYLVTNFKGIKIQDITDLKNPVSFAEYRAGGLKGMAHGIVVQNGHIYFVKKGLTVLKIEQD